MHSPRRWLFACVLACAALGASVADARAHQCDVLGKSPELEIWFIRKHPNVLLFCAPCGDKAPTPFQVAKASGVKGNVWPVEIDLTDTAGRTRRVKTSSVYVQLDPKVAVFTNVENRSVCQVIHTPHTIRPK